ncbi:MAG: hypothetical protein ACXV8P_02510 [Methylobacter sp.]
MRRLLIVFLFIPVISFGDYTTRNSDNTFEYTVYDESIKLINSDDQIVTFYVRTKKIKKGQSNDVFQYLYYCKTEYSSSRPDERHDFSTPEWMPPDSVGRAAGKYACLRAIMFDALINNRIFFESHKERNQSRQPERYEPAPTSCKTFLDCPAGQECKKAEGESVCKKIENKDNSEYKF